MAAAFKKLYRYLAPDAAKEEDGRDKWPSRASFILAAMGGAVGLGNLLRYPSVVFANNGLQWFIPYFIALFFLGIPVLILEISLGQAYRGSVVVAFNGIHKHTKGVGLAVIMTGFAVASYYVPILAWIMHYFRCSFRRTLPWTGRGEDFYLIDVIANPDPITPEIGYVQHTGRGLVAETVGWCAFMWFLVWLSMYKGVGMTGRVVYVTMGLPVVIMIIILGRSVSLDNARQGILLYVGEWHSEKLGQGQIWQAAAGQIFFSIGVGFGYFTSYASYNSRFANTVQDSLIIAFSNSAYEVIAAFAVFGVIGFLGYEPGDPSVSLSTFTVGFLTYPLAIAEMPGAPVWAVLFFLTLALLGLSSAFALIESFVTLICDSQLGQRTPRTIISTTVVVIAFLLSLLYCSRFGFYLLDAVDTWINNLCLVFVVWAECVAASTLYRYKDAVIQVGGIAYWIHSFGYILSMVLGVAVGHAAGPSAGAGVGFGIFIVSNAVAVILGKSPMTPAPRFFGKNPWLSKLWWLAFYPVNQLRRDLNLIVATGNKWKIPVAWSIIIRYITPPILAIIVSFAYPAFYQQRQDPLHIAAFMMAHLIMIITAVGFIVPRWFDVFIPLEKLHEGADMYTPTHGMATAHSMGVHDDHEKGHGVADKVSPSTSLT
ncbi:MAG: hypothetical protein LQ348_002868 [Seirophora lacunosa]|nr:MAG: hypothetical protein LQ348_002868 [Seirophora lacunosa]